MIKVIIHIIWSIIIIFDIMHDSIKNNVIININK